MIKYNKMHLASFEMYYYYNVDSDSILMSDWLAQQGAKYAWQNDVSDWDHNVLIFENPEDEVIFRLKWNL